MDLGDVSVKNFGNETDFLIKFENDNNKNIIEEIKANLDKSFGNTFNFRRVENVGPKVSAELLRSGVIAISVALFLMLVYIWIRFEWQFSLGAIVALFHDVIVTLGLFSLLGLEINLSIIAAVPKSINPRALLNRRFFTSEPIVELKNLSFGIVCTRFLTDLFIASAFLSTAISFVTGCFLKDKLISLNDLDIRVVAIKTMEFYLFIPIFLSLSLYSHQNQNNLVTTMLLNVDFLLHK